MFTHNILKRKRSDNDIYQKLQENFLATNEAALKHSVSIYESISQNLDTTNTAIMNIFCQYDYASSSTNATTTTTPPHISPPITIPPITTPPITIPPITTPPITLPNTPESMQLQDTSNGVLYCTFCNSSAHLHYKCPEIPPELRGHCYKCWRKGHVSSVCRNPPRELLDVMWELGLTYPANVLPNLRGAWRQFCLMEVFFSPCAWWFFFFL